MSKLTRRLSLFAWITWAALVAGAGFRLTSGLIVQRFNPAAAVAPQAALDAEARRLNANLLIEVREARAAQYRADDRIAELEAALAELQGQP